MPTSITPVTADQLLMMPSALRCELVRGEIRGRSPDGMNHGVVTAQLAYLITGRVKERDLGVVFAPDTGFWLASEPDTVRAPDVSFVSKARIQSIGIPKGYWPGAPDLAVEVVSPNDSLEEVEAKLDEYIAAGARLVWVVNPRRKSISTYRPGRQPVVLRNTDQLEGGDVVPGFSCKVADLFPR